MEQLRYKFLLLVLVWMWCLALGGSSVKAQSSESDVGQDTIAWESLPYADGEELIYYVYYNWGFLWIPAGEVKFSVIEKETHLEYNVTGRSFASYDEIFKVRDYYLSEVDKQTFLPTNFRRDILEGNYVRFDSIRFDQETHKVKEYFGKSRLEAKIYDFQLENVVQDMVSVIYHLRGQPVENYTKGERIPVEIFFDKEFFQLDVVYKGIVNKKIKGHGRKNVYHLQPELIDGYVFKKGDLMDIWVSQDDLKVPILIESPISCLLYTSPSPRDS